VAREVSRLLCAYVAETRRVRTMADETARAVRLLGRFRTPEGRALIERLARRRRLWFRGAPWQVRLAARETLASVRALEANDV
jgi:hypothetical protein